MRFGLFGKAEARKGADAKAEAKATAERLKAQVRELLGLPEMAAIAVNEIICADPACPGMETVILVMEPGRKTQAFKLQMAMPDVSRENLAQVLGDRLSVPPA